MRYYYEKERSKYRGVKIAFGILIVSLIGTACIHTLVTARRAGAVSRNEGPVHATASITAANGCRALGTDCKRTPQGTYDCTDIATKVRIYELTNGGRETIKWKENKKVKMIVTGYTSRVQETDSTPEIGAAGENIWELFKRGVNTCATNDWKFGTRLEVQGLGTCVVKDRMNARYTGGERLDWYFGKNVEKARGYGRQVVEVTILH